MKTPPEKLLEETLSEIEFRAASLERTLDAVRRRRHQREMIRAVGVAAVCIAAAAVIFLQRDFATSPKTVPTVAVQNSPRTIPGTDIRLLNDAELLAMFPGRPIALIGTGNDRQLVFLDEQRLNGNSPN